MNGTKIRVKNLALLIVGHLTGPVMNFAVALYCTHDTQKEGYATLMTFLSMSLVFYGFNAKASIQRLGAKDYNENTQIQNFLNLAYVPVLLGSILILDNGNYLLLTLTVWIYCSLEIVFERLRYTFCLNRYLLLRLLKATLDLFIFWFLYDTSNLLSSRILSILFSSAITLCFLPRFIIFPFNLIKITAIKCHLKSNLGMLFYSGSMIIFNFFDRFLLDYHEANYYYTYFLMSSAAGIQVMLGAALAPWFMKTRADMDSLRIREAFFFLSSQTVIALVVFCALWVTVELSLIVLEGNWPLIFGGISVAFIIQGQYIRRVQKFIADSRSLALLKIVLPALCISLLINYSFIPKFGVMASLCGLIISSIILLHGTYRVK
ncbi:hypothetical protein OAK56_00005 [bacterium]|nr:hypothetical protein [Akkermansiaceae bacterium]MDC0277194.1 hypothetical protein [bacterium]